MPDVFAEDGVMFTLRSYGRLKGRRFGGPPPRPAVSKECEQATDAVGAVAKGLSA